MATRRKTETPADGGGRTTLAAIEAGLAEVADGLEILDRDVLVSDVRVDLVAADPDGRLALVLAVDGGADVCLVRTAAAAVLARSDADLLARHLGRAPSAEAPVVVVVAPRFEEAALARLALLAGFDLLLFELRELSSATRSGVYLAPCPLARGLTAVGGPPPRPTLGPEDVLAGLSGGRAALARSLAARLERLDDEIACEAALDAAGAVLRWRLGDEVVCALHVDGDDLRVRLPDEVDEGAIRLLEAGDVEDVVERVVDRHVALLTADDSPRRHGRPALDESFVIPGPAEILTQEELQAFRD